MTEPKSSAASVAEFEKREMELAEARSTLKASILSQVEAHIAELHRLGYKFHLAEGSENGRPKRSGRPRKEQTNGEEERS